MTLHRWFLTLAGAALICCPPTPCQTVVQSSPESTIDPMAEEIVRQWIANPPQQQNLRVVVSDSMDRPEADGQRILYTHQRTATISRPNHMRIESRGDLQNRDAIYDGETLTIFDLDHQVYGQLEFEGTLDEMIDAVQEWYDVTTPLADLLVQDRGAVLDDVITGRHIGMSSVDGHECHHVAFTREDIDWQAWIDAGEQPILRRLVLTYKTEPGTPQYTLTLDQVEFPEEIAPEVFAFEPPEGATLIRFLEAEELFGADGTAAEISSPEVVQ